MKSGRFSAAVPPLLLAVLCAVLGGRVYDEWQLSQQPVRIDEPSPAAAAPAPAAEAPLVTPAAGAFAAIVERPLFSPTRRPPAAAPPPAPAPEVVAAPTPLAPMDFSLAGVVISGGTRSALVQMQADGRQVRVAEGGAIDGWTLVTVEPQRAVFRRDDSVQALVLDYLKAVPPGQVPPPVPQRLPLQPPQEPTLQSPPAAEQPQQQGNESFVGTSADGQPQQ